MKKRIWPASSKLRNPPEVNAPATSKNSRLQKKMERKYDTFYHGPTLLGSAKELQKLSQSVIFDTQVFTTFKQKTTTLVQTAEYKKPQTTPKEKDHIRVKSFIKKYLGKYCFQLISRDQFGDKKNGFKKLVGGAFHWSYVQFLLKPGSFSCFITSILKSQVIPAI